MEKWLDCRISPGQFDGEFAVHGELFDNSEFSLFAQSKDLKFKEKPTPKKPVKGELRVIPLDQKDDRVLVALPQTTFENGRTITVKKSQVK